MVTVKFWGHCLVKLSAIVARPLRYRLLLWSSAAVASDLRDRLSSSTSSTGEWSVPYHYCSQEKPFTCGYAAIRMILAGRGTHIPEAQIVAAARSIKTYSDKKYFTMPDLAHFLRSHGFRIYYSNQWNENDIRSASMARMHVLMSVNAVALRNLYNLRRIEVDLPTWAYDIPDSNLFDGHTVLLRGARLSSDGISTYAISDPGTLGKESFCVSSEELHEIAHDVWGIGWKIEASVVQHEDLGVLASSAVSVTPTATA